MFISPSSSVLNELNCSISDKGYISWMYVNCFLCFRAKGSIRRNASNSSFVDCFVHGMCYVLKLVQCETKKINKFNSILKIGLLACLLLCDNAAVETSMLL